VRAAKRVGTPFTAASLVAVALLVAGCASDGRTLRAPPPGASAPAVPRTTTPGQSTAVAPIALTSTEFEPGGPIPLDYTCDGAGTSPPLAWGAVPEGTSELALTVIDTDANGFVHWVLAGLDPTVQALATGVVPDGAIQAKNGKGTAGWTGPCPPKQAGPHHYVFTLYALTAASGVTTEMNGTEAIAAISKVPGLTATLIGAYTRA
jgi:Raf kinase inhibitor-like YbhB/YbcL family protein